LGETRRLRSRPGVVDIFGRRAQSTSSPILVVGRFPQSFGPDAHRKTVGSRSSNFGPSSYGAVMQAAGLRWSMPTWP